MAIKFNTNIIGKTMSYMPPQFHVQHKYIPNSNEQTHLQGPVQGRPLDHGLQLQSNATSTCMVSSTSVSVFITYLLTTIIYVLIIYMNHLVTQQPPKILCTYVQDLACTINVSKVKPNFNSVKVHPQLSRQSIGGFNGALVAVGTLSMGRYVVPKRT